MRRAIIATRALAVPTAFCTAWICAAGASAADEVPLPIPEGVLPLEIPVDNPLTQAKVELGRKLYFDTRLSTDDKVACATCHDPLHGFADGRAQTSPGVGGARGPRNSPTTLNAAFLSAQFWDGRAATLEDQALQPLINPIEMGFPDHDAVVAKLKGIADWQAELDRMVKEGDRLFHSDELGSNGIACAMCHPNAANTHPETYPKFQTQLKKVALVRDMVNWCIENPLEGKRLAADDEKMIALESYIASQRKGVKLEAGKH